MNGADVAGKARHGTKVGRIAVGILVEPVPGRGVADENHLLGISDGWQGFLQFGYLATLIDPGQVAQASHASTFALEQVECRKHDFLAVVEKIEADAADNRRHRRHVVGGSSAVAVKTAFVDSNAVVSRQHRVDLRIRIEDSRAVFRFEIAHRRGSRCTHQRPEVGDIVVKAFLTTLETAIVVKILCSAPRTAGKTDQPFVGRGAHGTVHVNDRSCAIKAADFGIQGQCHPGVVAQLPDLVRRRRFGLRLGRIEEFAAQRVHPIWVAAVVDLCARDQRYEENGSPKPATHRSAPHSSCPKINSAGSGVSRQSGNGPCISTALDQGFGNMFERQGSVAACAERGPFRRACHCRTRISACWTPVPRPDCTK